MATTTNLLTAEQFFELPDPGVPTELVRGEVMMMNMPGLRHGFVCMNIGFELRLYLRDHDLGRVFGNDSGVVTEHDPDSVRGPDVSYYGYQRLPREQLPLGYAEAKPELVFEVKSPSDPWTALRAKVVEYLKAGVTIVCVADPESESVVVYHAEKQEAIVRGDEPLTLPDLLPGFSVPVRKLFHA